MSLKVGKDAFMLSPDTIDRARYHSFQSGIGYHLTGKDILVFCDGTGKDGKQNTDNKTNVWRLYKLALSPKTSDQRGWGPIKSSTLRQHEIIYLPGVGSGSNRNPYNLLVRIFGSTIVDNIVEAYLHVAKHYEAGSKVYLFGYSRGAFVVRKVASLIYRIGIIRNREEVLKLWDRHERPVPWNLIESPPRGSAIRIQALIVWDTVGAIRSVHPKSKMEADILGMSDDELPPNVNHAFHVVAFHENRKLFRVTLFQPTQPDSKQETKLKEVWFPGAHSDVGGGDVKKVGLPDISLIWIIGELQNTCSLSISHDDLEYPTDIQKLSPSDAYHESPKWKRLLDKCEPRLGLLSKRSLVHETVFYLKNSMPDNLDPRSKSKSQMLTINDLGPLQWDIKASLVARSAFEMLKHANAMAKHKLKEQAAHYRTRVNSLYTPHTPRSSISATDQIPTRDECTPQPRRSSVTGNASPPTSTPPKTATRQRAGSYRPARAQSLVPGQVARQEPALATRGLSRHNAHSGGVTAFHESAPRTWQDLRANDANPRPGEKHRDDKAHPKGIQPMYGKFGQ